MSQNADATYAATILRSQLEAERTCLKQTDMDIARLGFKKVEHARRIELLEVAVSKVSA